MKVFSLVVFALFMFVVQTSAAVSEQFDEKENAMKRQLGCAPGCQGMGLADCAANCNPQCCTSPKQVAAAFLQAAGNALCPPQCPQPGAMGGMGAMPGMMPGMGAMPGMMGGMCPPGCPNNCCPPPMPPPPPPPPSPIAAIQAAGLAAQTAVGLAAQALSGLCPDICQKQCQACNMACCNALLAKCAQNAAMAGCH